MTDAATRDLRASISETADQVLEAVAIATDRTKQEVVREVLDLWATKEIHRSTLVERMTRRDGKPRREAE